MELLDDGVKMGAVIATDMARKITVGGITKTYPVYKVRLDLLYYNNQNDRIATWISQYQTEHDEIAPSLDNKEEYNKIIEKYIIESNPSAINKTRENIKKVGQKEPAVVLSDGCIIDGNRRFTCLRLLSKESDVFNYLETIILESSVASNSKQIKMLELSIQHGEEGKVDYNPVDVLVGLYHDVVETKLLTINEYARSTNEKTGAVRKKLEVAQLMVEYLDFINAPKQYHIVRELQLLFPLEELNKMLKKCQSNDEAEDLKICIFTNILMRTSEDLGRFVRKIKDVMSSPFYNDFIEEQKVIAAEVLDILPPVGQVDSEVLRDTVKNNSSICKKLEHSLNTTISKIENDESENRPLQILENVNTLLSTISVDMCNDFTNDDNDAIKEQITTANNYLKTLSEYIGD